MRNLRFHQCNLELSMKLILTADRDLLQQLMHLVVHCFVALLLPKSEVETFQVDYQHSYGVQISNSK